jgi:hypothetical protein
LPKDNLLRYIFSQCIVEESTFFVGLDKRQFISLFHDRAF